MNNQRDGALWSTREYWDRRFRAADTPWELGAPSSVLMEACSELRGLGVTFDGARVLSPGCGRGADALELVSLGSTVIGIEWSEDVARDLVSRYRIVAEGSRGSLEVRSGDFFALAPEHVDIVCEHTFLCAIDPAQRVQYADTISSWIKPGGYLCGNFFVLHEDEACRFPGLSLTKEGFGPPFGITKNALVALLETYFSVVVLRPGVQPAQARRPGLEWVGLFRRLP